MGKSTPDAEGIDRAALDSLVRDAKRTHSSAVVIVRNGKLVGEWYFDGAARRIEAMSATKSIVSLAIGMLVDDGKLRSLDQPCSDFFPEWKDGRRITVRHLLNHTSGLQADSDSKEVYAVTDSVALALAATLANEPGSRFFYNNKAVNLLPAIVEKVSGEDIATYLYKRLFEPLGIKDVFWVGDQAGHPYGMSGLQILPVDFAKIGQMMLDGGVWQGRRIVSASWLATSTQHASQSFDPTNGLLWWLKFERRQFRLPAGSLARLRERTANPEWLAVIERIEGRPFPDVVALLAAVRAELGEQGTWKLWAELKAAGVDVTVDVEGTPDGFAAQGYLGQYLIVMPSRHLVAVRMAVENDEMSWDTMEFREFEDRVRALVP